MRIRICAVVLMLAAVLGAQQPGVLAGVVVDRHLRPVAGATVECLPELGGTMADVPVVDARTAAAAVRSSEGGGFRFTALAEGPWRLRATMADGRAAELVTAPPIGQVLLRLQPGLQTERFRVRTAEGERIAGASVRAFDLSGSSPRREFDGAPDAVAVTDADGMCTLSLGTAWGVVATAPDGRVGMLRGAGTRGPHDWHHAIVVDRTGGLSGRVVGVDADALRDAAVSVLWADAGLDGDCRGLVTSAPVVDGRFSFAVLPAGQVTVMLRSPGNVAMLLELDHMRMPCTPGVVVRAGEEREVELRVVPGVAVEGMVRDSTQRALGGAIVGATVVLEGPIPDRSRGGPVMVEHGVRVQDLVGDLAFPERAAAPHPLAQRSVRCDERGRYRIDAVVPGTYRLRVHAAGHTLVERRCEVPDGGLTEDFELVPGGAVQGIVDRSSYFHLAAIRDGDGAPSSIVILPFHGAFSLGGLAAGRWHFARSSNKQLVRLGSVEVVAGRTAWIDLRDAQPGVISGRVLDAAGEALTGGVELFHDHQLLAADGSFVFRRATPFLEHQQPQFELFVDELPRRWRLPNEAVGVRDWRGDVRLGANELRLEVHDAEDRPVAAAVWFGGPDLAGSYVQVPVGGRVLRHLRDGRYTASVGDERCYVPWQQFELPVTTHLVLRAQPVGVVEVTVLDRNGHVKPFFDVVAKPVDGVEQGPRNRRRSDADGRARLVVPVGTARIGSDRPGGAPIAVEAVVESGKSSQVTLRVQ